MIWSVRLYTLCNGGGRWQPGRPEARCVFSSQSGPLTLDVPSQTTAWRAVVRVLRSPVDSLSCALFPNPCCACGGPLLEISRVPVCVACWKSIETDASACCFLCGEDLRLGDQRGTLASPGSASPAEQLCLLCQKAPPPFRRFAAVGAYRGTLRSLIHALKYDGMFPVAEGLGSRLGERIVSLGSESAAGLPQQMLVVPVPLHGSRRRSQSFNHAELLARAALREVGRQRPEWRLTLAAHLLERKRATVAQAGLTSHQRRLNVRGAFVAPHPGPLTDAHVMLIDDIYTTGATARACSKALLDAGAASVWVATVARAQFEHLARPQLESFMEVLNEKLEDVEDVPMAEDVAFWNAAEERAVQ